MFISSSCSHSQVGRVRMSPCKLNKRHFNFQAEGQGSPKQTIVCTQAAYSTLSVIIVTKAKGE